jgi:hypothetical protein
VVLAEDVGRILAYHRSRVEREQPERIVLLGLSGEAAEAVGANLPAPPVPFPEDATPVRGGGRVSLTKALDACRAAPAALGAALAAVATPRDEELTIRPLPTTLPRPPSGGRSWVAAAVLLWAALAVTWIGLKTQRDRLEEVLAGSDGPETPTLSAADADRIRRLSRLAALELSFPAAAATALRAIPGEDAAPFRTEHLLLNAGADGSYDVRLAVLLLHAGSDPRDSRVEAAARRFADATGTEPIQEATGGNFRISGTFRAGGEK